MVEPSVVGTWRLVSCELRTADGQVSYPFGEDALGYIMYTAEGRMGVILAAADRPQFASGDILGGRTEEVVAAAKSFTSYFGTYELRGDRVVHHIEVSFFPNWIGVDQERVFEFDGDRLLLSTPPTLIQGAQRTAHLIWERT